MSDVQSPGKHIIFYIVILYHIILAIHQIKISIEQHKTAEVSHNCHLVVTLSCHIVFQLKIPGPPHARTPFRRHPTNRNGKSNGETDQDKQAEDVQVVAHLVKELY